MKVFSTRSCEHLIDQMNVERGAATIKNFSDGELYIKIEEDVACQNVWVLASTQAPADNLLELYLMLDALQRMNARIYLLITYFAYARQDRAEPGEAFSSEVIFRFLQQFTIARTFIVHIHNPEVRMFFDFEDLILLDFFVPIIEQVDYLVAPDEGAANFTRALAQRTKKPVSVMKKVRSAHEQIKRIELDNGVADKNVLIVDDMIATGGTVCNAAKVLRDYGAKNIFVAATHGIFSGNAYEAIAQSQISKVYVTNSLAQKEGKPKIEVIDCSVMLEQVILSS